MLPNYPNISDAWDVGVISQKYLENDIDDPSFNGARYVLPTEVAGDVEDIAMWNYGVFVRGDVPEALGIDPTSIKTTEELLDFMQKAKDYGFKDVNGNDCIVATTFHNGWSYDNYLQSYNEKKLTGYSLDADGNVTYEKKSYGFTQKKELGNLLNTNELVEDLSELFLTIAYSLPYCLFESLGFVLFIGFFVSWKLDLVLLLLIPFAYFFKIITERMRLVNREIVDAQASSRHFFIDTLAKLDLVKANGYGEKIDAIYQKKNGAICASQKSLERKKAGFSWVQFLLENGIKLVVPIYAVLLYRRGEITPGGIAVSTAIFSSFLVPSVFQLIQMYKDFRGAEPVVRNVLQVIEEEEEEPVVYERRDIEDHLILLQQLSFSYGDKPVLSQIDMTIPVTGSIAIKGMSGEGKSTLLKVISGLYGPKKGTIVYNQRFFPAFVPDAVSYLSTNSFFVEDTVEKNIFLESERSALFVDAPRINQFLESEINTVVDENGSNFSGGQQKLIGFARAAAKKSALLVLDEPTASLDENTKKEVVNQIEELSKSLCVIVASHDEDLCRRMDACYILEGGTLKQGTL